MFGPASLSEFALFLLLIIVLGVVLAVFRIESAIKPDKEKARAKLPNAAEAAAAKRSQEAQH